MKKFLFILLIPQVLISIPLASQETNKISKWVTVAGYWQTRVDRKEAYVTENVGKTLNLGYSDLINRNALITRDPLKEYTAIRADMVIDNPRKVPVSVGLFFGEKAQTDFYAFRFEGNEKLINKIVLVRSKVKDTTLPSMAKWNFTVTEEASLETSLPYGKKMEVNVETDGKKITLYLDGKKILKHRADERVDSGRIGFSNRHARPRIANLRVYNDKSVVFEDDFRGDSISRFIIKRQPAR